MPLVLLLVWNACRETYSISSKDVLYHTILVRGQVQDQNDEAENQGPSDLAAELDDMMGMFTEEVTLPPLPTHFSHLTVGESLLDAASSSDSSPSLIVHGDALVHGSLTADSWHLSDERAKSNITPANHDALGIIQSLEVYHYYLKHSVIGRRMIGVLAQQVRPFYPDAVETDQTTGLLRVSSSSLHYLMLQAIQQLSKQFQDFRDETNGRLGLVMLWAASWVQSAKSEVHDLVSRLTASSRPPNVASPPLPADLGISAEAGADSSPQMSGTQHAPSPDVSAVLQPKSTGQHTGQVIHADHASSSQPSSSEVSAPSFEFATEEAMVSHMLAALEEENAGVAGMCRKRIAQLGRPSVWQSFQQAHAEGSCNGAHTAGSMFINLLDKKQHDDKMRYLFSLIKLKAALPILGLHLHCLPVATSN